MWQLQGQLIPEGWALGLPTYRWVQMPVQMLAQVQGPAAMPGRSKGTDVVYRDIPSPVKFQFAFFSHSSAGGH